LLKDRVEGGVFWLSSLTLTFLLLEDLLLFSFLSERLPGFDRYAQLYSALTVAGLISILILHLFITDRELPYAALITAFGALTRLLAVRSLPWYADVLKATEEAARTLTSGGNPYTHIFSTGPRDVFAYPPFEPIYYLPFLSVDVRYGEVFASTVTLTLIYLAGKFFRSKLTLPTLTFYAFSGLLIASAGIGANDVSAGMLAALATFLFTLSTCKGSSKILVVSAVVAGLAVCFKQFSILYPFFALIYLKKRKLNWRLYLSPFLATVGSISTPFLILSPLQYLREVLSFHLAERIYSPQFILYYLLPKALNPIYESPLWIIVHIAALLLTLTFLAHKTEALPHIIAYPTLAWLILLFLGRYLTISYFAFLAPEICLLILISNNKS
jgi:uncharacterized membrane protein